MFDFSGMWLPVITPFREGRVDHVALSRLVAYYRDCGVHGFVALSTTGEALALTCGEQDAVLNTIMMAADGRPVIAGVTGINAEQMIARIAELGCLRVAGHRLAGLMVSSPAYIRPSQAGLVAYFTKLADLSVLPLVLYEIPYRTGVTMTLETLLLLARHPQIQAIKDCAGSVAITQALITDGGLQVLAGEDMNVLQSLSMGARGAITAGMHVSPEELIRLYECVRYGDLAEAQRIFRVFAPLVAWLYAEPNPAPVKGWLAAQGWMTDELRFPLLPASRGVVERLVALTMAEVAA